MKRSKALQAAQIKYLSGKEKPLVFRVDGEPREKLRQLQEPGESDNQTAKRLLLGLLEQI